jgi:hypothetical protein
MRRHASRAAHLGQHGDVKELLKQVAEMQPFRDGAVTEIDDQNYPLRRQDTNCPISRSALSAGLSRLKPPLSATHRAVDRMEA